MERDSLGEGEPDDVCGRDTESDVDLVLVLTVDAVGEDVPEVEADEVAVRVVGMDRVSVRLTP